MYGLGEVEAGGGNRGSFLGRSTAAALLMAIGGLLAGCGGAGNDESVGSASSALTYDATKVGCPNSGYVAIKSWNGYYCRPNTSSNMTCYSTTLESEGYFRIVDNGDGTIAIRARDGANQSWDGYVYANAGGGYGLYHGPRSPLDYDAKFVVQSDRVGYLSFRANNQWTLVTAQNGGGGIMRADVYGTASNYERFQVECY